MKVSVMHWNEKFLKSDRNFYKIGQTIKINTGTGNDYNFVGHRALEPEMLDKFLIGKYGVGPDPDPVRHRPDHRFNSYLPDLSEGVL